MPSPASPPRGQVILECEHFLRSLLDSWNSRYSYTITFNSMAQYCVFFDVDWCRVPSPHLPLPDVRALTHFAVAFFRPPSNPRVPPQPWEPSPLPANFVLNLPSNRQQQQQQSGAVSLSLGAPRVSWRAQHEDRVHTDVTRDIDEHVLRILKAKTLFNSRNMSSFQLEHATRFASRSRADPPRDEQQGLGVAGAAEAAAAAAAAAARASSSSASAAPAAPVARSTVPQLEAALTAALRPYITHASAGSSASSNVSAGGAGGATVPLSAVLRVSARTLPAHGYPALAPRDALQTAHALLSLDALAAAGSGSDSGSGAGAAAAVAAAGESADEGALSLAGVPGRVTGRATEGAVLAATAAAAAPALPSLAALSTPVPVADAVAAVAEVAAALAATAAAVAAVALEAREAHSAAARRLRAAAPALHASMDLPLVALDPNETGVVSADELVLLLGGVEGLALRPAEARAVLARLPRDCSSSGSSGAGSSDGSSSAGVLYQHLQLHYESILLAALAEAELERARNDVGGYLLEVMRARKRADVSGHGSGSAGGSAASESSSGEAAGGAGEKMRADRVAAALVDDAARVRLSALQVYAFLAAAGYLDRGFADGAGVGAGSATSGSNGDSNGAASGAGDDAGAALLAAIAANANNSGASAGSGGSAVPFVDIVSFSRIVSLVVYRLFEDETAAATQSASIAAAVPQLAAFLQTGSGAAGPGSDGGASADAGDSAAGAGLGALGALATLTLSNGSAGGSGSGSGAVVELSGDQLSELSRLMRLKFVEFDADDDDRLSGSEFAALVADSAVCLSAAQIAELCAAADTNQDGFVDWAELMAFAQTTLLPLAGAQRASDLAAAATAAATAAITSQTKAQ